MCTTISFTTSDHYFGRNLDLEYSYQETVTITPRKYPLLFRKATTLSQHYAMIGMAYIQEKYPLYYEATNEKGLSMAGLNFPGNADYKPSHPDKDNITPFEFIPWVLGQCSTVKDAETLLKHINLFNEAFRADLPLSPLHWMISDRDCSIVVESVKDGLNIYQNPLNVLTNNPPFPQQLTHFRNWKNNSQNLPGDWTSESRFIRASHILQHSVCGASETESVNQFFHILSSVEFPKGCISPKNGKYPFTIYSCCCNTDKGIYYYKTYNNSQVISTALHKENLDSLQLICYDLCATKKIIAEDIIKTYS